MEKYEPLGVIGEGSYGIVLKCKTKDSEKSVAIKKFIDSEDDKNVKKIALREIRVLRKLRHENLVSLIEVFKRRKHLYLVFEFIDHTLLDQLEQSSNGLEAEKCRKYTFQILRGLGFCHDNNIIHRDIKPENILVTKNDVIKLCDFGFARNLCGPGDVYTDYVATRWYRAPELLVGDVAYGKEVDIWAVGCLFAEMMSGDPLFPGDSDIDQLFLIAQCLGRLSRKHIHLMSQNSAFQNFKFPKSRCGSTNSTSSINIYGADSSNSSSLKLNGIRGTSGESDAKGRSRANSVSKSIFSSKFPSWKEEQVQFISVCLHPEPERRPNCTALLRLPYFTHDGFTTRFIGELRAKLEEEGCHMTSFSTNYRKKSSSMIAQTPSQRSRDPKANTLRLSQHWLESPLRKTFQQMHKYKGNKNLFGEKPISKPSSNSEDIQSQKDFTVSTSPTLPVSNLPNQKFILNREKTFIVPDKPPVCYGMMEDRKFSEDLSLSLQGNGKEKQEELSGLDPVKNPVGKRFSVHNPFSVRYSGKRRSFSIHDSLAPDAQNIENHRGLLPITNLTFNGVSNSSSDDYDHLSGFSRVSQRSPAKYDSQCQHNKNSGPFSKSPNYGNATYLKISSKPNSVVTQTNLFSSPLRKFSLNGNNSSLGNNLPLSNSLSGHLSSENLSFIKSQGIAASREKTHLNGVLPESFLPKMNSKFASTQGNQTVPHGEESYPTGEHPKGKTVLSRLKTEKDQKIWEDRNIQQPQGRRTSGFHPANHCPVIIMDRPTRSQKKYDEQSQSSDEDEDHHGRRKSHHSGHRRSTYERQFHSDDRGSYSSDESFPYDHPKHRGHHRNDHHKHRRHSSFAENNELAHTGHKHSRHTEHRHRRHSDSRSEGSHHRRHSQHHSHHYERHGQKHHHHGEDHNHPLKKTSENIMRRYLRPLITKKSSGANKVSDQNETVSMQMLKDPLYRHRKSRDSDDLGSEDSEQLLGETTSEFEQPVAKANSEQSQLNEPQIPTIDDDDDAAPASTLQPHTVQVTESMISVQLQAQDLKKQKVDAMQRRLSRVYEEDEEETSISNLTANQVLKKRVSNEQTIKRHTMALRVISISLGIIGVSYFILIVTALCMNTISALAFRYVKENILALFFYISSPIQCGGSAGMIYISTIYLKSIRTYYLRFPISLLLPIFSFVYLVRWIKEGKVVLQTYLNYSLKNLDSLKELYVISDLLYQFNCCQINAAVLVDTGADKILSNSSSVENLNLLPLLCCHSYIVYTFETCGKYEPSNDSTECLAMLSKLYTSILIFVSILIALQITLIFISFIWALRLQICLDEFVPIQYSTSQVTKPFEKPVVDGN